MEFEEINVLESNIHQMDHEGQFTDITVDVGNGNNIYSQKVLIHDWSSWKMDEEINMERTRYLLSTDDMLEEWHSCTN